MRDHCTPFRMAKTKPWQSQVVERCWATETHILCWWEWMVQPHWKTGWQSLTHLNMTPYNPAILLLGIYPTEMKMYVNTKTYYMIQFLWYSWEGKITGIQNRQVVARVWEQGYRLTMKGHEGTFWGDGNVLSETGDGYTVEYVCQKSWNYTPKGVNFIVYTSHLNRLDF